MPGLDGRVRLATREEFKAEFDRVLSSGTEPEQRALGVLANPLLGFTPRDRPVFRRVLAMQYVLHAQLAERPVGDLFEESLIVGVLRFIRNLEARSG